MTIEEEVFQKQRPDFTKLTAAGFTKRKRDYQFEQDFMAGQLRAVVRVDFTGHVSGNVIDNGTGEEYLPLSSVHCGPFAAQVKTGYIDLLGEIARRCSVPEPFHGAQANRLSAWIQQEFHDQPEFVFKKLPDYAVFREPQSQKWYGLVMNISWAQLTGKTSASQDKSSAGTLPLYVECLTKKLGVSEEIANFVGSLGTAVGMSGCAGIWPPLLAIYTIHSMGGNILVTQAIIIIILCPIVSFGTAGVPGGGIMLATAMFVVLGLPVGLISIFAGIDSFADMTRTMTNVTSSMVASTLVSQSEKRASAK